MSESNKSYRIKTKINPKEETDKYLNVKLDNDIDILEILSLKLKTKNFYKLHTSNYGCIAGRVLANGAVGIPNAKISVFISLDDSETDDPIITQIYPYSYSYQKNNDGVRYNLLPNEQVSDCHTPVGTFPSKRMVLDDDNVIEVFDKYYKYTTRSNDAGDYMLFGIPVGENVVHVDIDLSDIGALSQRPKDLIYKGYNITQFENANKFKSDTNLDNLSQIITQNTSVNVASFWGDKDSGSEIKITRNDIEIQYKFEPTCVFIGSLITDTKSQGISKKCIATDRMGKMDTLTTGSGTIEMIRKKPDGSVEETQIQGNQLIDGNGTWCYQIPMNLDYYMTDEYGNFVPSDNQEKGIPTRARVRFRVSLTDYQSDYENNHLAKVLIPNNPKSFSDLDYHFGSETNDSEDGTKSFRDLFWNNIYTVKQYIPRLQKGNNQRNKKFTGIKNINVNNGNNPIPYNNMRVDLTFMFTLQCALLKGLIKVLTFINALKKFKSSKKTCSSLGDGICPDLENWYFAPGCPNGYLSTTLRTIRETAGDDTKSADVTNRDDEPGENYCVTKKTDYLMQCVEINLAMEYNVIQFDFYNDWINGMVYIPRWFVNIRKKRSYLFGLIRRKAKTEACMETNNLSRRFVQQCALSYTKDNNNNYTAVTTSLGCQNDKKQKCHKGKGRKYVKVLGSTNTKGGGGLVHIESTLKKQNVYYFKPAEWHNVNNNNYGTRCILFATDIVLLGSLNKCDENGIPQVFEELTSSTYVMPSNLASTNMDSQGFMYGYNGHGTRCSGQYNIFNDKEPLEQLDQTFDNYVEWSKNTDYYDNVQDDALEYAVTEASGIDWGYHGPNQGGNNLGKLYFPGGHFLGISCFNSEVNIKSCVNLARACEIGSMPSQRQHMLSREYNNGEYVIKNQYLVPNGLISKYDINDSNFRRIFATLNHNGLKTKRNEETRFLEYDFEYMHPTNFSGELKNKIGMDDKSYRWEGYDDSTKEKDSLTKAYRRVMETNSSDYYYFRLGLHNNANDTDKKSKYLINNGNTVSLPMYENSYYFYFGLKDGNTAIDRFFKDFYAPCDIEDEDASYFTIEKITGDVCSGNDSGVEITVNNVEPPYFVSLALNGDNHTELYLKKGDGNNIIVSATDNNGSHTLVHNQSKFKFVGLTSGSYTLTMMANGMDSVSKTFTVEENLSNAISSIDIVVTDFNTISYNENNNLKNFYGSVKIMNIEEDSICGVLVATDEKYILKQSKSYPSSRYDLTKYIKKVIDLNILIKLSDTNVKTTTDSNGKAIYTFPSWKGNDTYYTYLLYPCGSTIKIRQLGSYRVDMSKNFDLVFGDEDFTYLNTYRLMNKSDWYKDVLESSDYTNKQKWNFKQSLFFKGSMYSSTACGNIDAEAINGIYPYNEKLWGSGEMVTYNDDEDKDNEIYITVSSNEFNNSSITDSEYDLSLHGFYFPTSYFKEGKIVDYATNGYIKNGSDKNTKYDGLVVPKDPKRVYKYKASDGNNTQLSTDYIYLPSIYRPFFTTCVKYINDDTASVCYLAAVNNAVTYGGKVSSVRLNNKLYNDRLAFAETFEGDCTNRLIWKEATSNNYSNGDESFSLAIKEGGPGGNYNGGIGIGTLSVSRTAHFPCSSDSDDEFYYSEGIKFYHCRKKSNNFTINGSKITDDSNNVKVKNSYQMVLSNTTSFDDVKIHFFTSLDNDASHMVLHSKDEFNPLTDASGLNGRYDTARDEKDYSYSYSFVSDNTYKSVSVDFCKGDNVTIRSNIGYNYFIINDKNEMIGSPETVVVDTNEDGDVVENYIEIKKDFYGKVLITVKKPKTSDATTLFRIKHYQSKFSYGFVSTNAFTATYKGEDTIYFGYIELNDGISLSAKINGKIVKALTTNGHDTLGYLNTILNSHIDKDYSSIGNLSWNGIFGNLQYEVIDDSDKLTMEAINDYAKANKLSKWDAFNAIIKNVIKSDVFAIVDEWTSIDVGRGEDEETHYSQNHNNIWKYIYPDNNSIAIVKYYPNKTN